LRIETQVIEGLGWRNNNTFLVDDGR
jgi:hypothetical protein